ncbi:MAG: hypothetical protein LCI00_08275 [Chloroflexi bacterium]|nr:hypothetical protein [Chloroflexota bacterium]
MSAGNIAGMYELVAAFGLLADVILDDPLLALANAVVWLDPLWEWSEDDVSEEGDGVGIALSVTRSAFPDIYAGAVERIRSDSSYGELDDFISGEISKRGIPLDNLEFLGYGIPLNACGIELSDPEVYAVHPDLLPLVELFGIHPEQEHYHVEIPQAAYAAGRVIADSLVKQSDKGLQQVGWALAWLFSCSGNSLVDFTDESLAEMQPLTWEADEVAFAIDLVAEADEVMTDVNAGLELLGSRPDVLTALSTNVKRVYKVIAKQKGKDRECDVRLEWPPPGTGCDGAAIADSELLQLRRDAA